MSQHLTLARMRVAAPGVLATLVVNGAFAALLFSSSRPHLDLLKPAAVPAAVVFWLSPEASQNNSAAGAGIRASKQEYRLASPGGGQLAVGRAVPRESASELDASYLPGGSLDIGPEPAGAPDLSTATRLAVFGGTVRLRVYVSRFGLPDRVEVLNVPMDPEFARGLCQALEKTSFVPGRVAGHEVAAYVDYEFQTSVLVVLPQTPPA